MSDTMLPDASPDTAPRRAGVRRVNNLPVYIVVGIAMVFLLIIMVVAMNRAEQQNVAHEEEAATETGNTNLLAAMITGDFKEGIIEPKAAPPVVPDTQSEIIIAYPDHAENLDLPPLPPGEQMHAGNNPDENHIRMMKMQQFEDAVKARTNVPMTAPRSAASSPGYAPSASGGTPGRAEQLAQLAAIRQQINAQANDDPTAAYQARLQQIKDSGPGGAGDGTDTDGLAPHLLHADTNRANNDYANFDATRQEDRWKLDSQPVAPRTPYSLLPGFVIPAVLISGINSELPGQILAQVSQDVYDTATGKHRLMPQGARLVGEYSSEVAFGQSRVLVAWQRIIFPDGKTMDIGAMPGTDGIGQSGFNDKTNNHYLRIFGSALLMSAVIAGATYSQRDAGGGGGVYGRQNAGSVLSQSLGQQLGQAATRLMMKNLNIAPTLEIRPGFRFNVVVTKDMVFSKPYQAFN